MSGSVTFPLLFMLDNTRTYLTFMECYSEVYENNEIRKANKAMKKKHGLEYVHNRHGGNHDLYDLKDKDGNDINLKPKGHDDQPGMTVSKDPKKIKKYVPMNAKDDMKKLDSMDELIKSVRKS